MNRIVQPELLDTLPPADPRAIGSRRDLNRINWLMRNPAIMAGVLKEHWRGPAPVQLTELGAGDGCFLHHVAKRLVQYWPKVRVTLLDLQKNVTPQRLASLDALGWHPELLVTDVFDWPRTFEPGGVVIANLFLHHFEEASLARLLRLVAARTELFVAIEPRRAVWPQFLTRCLWTFGCNDVTRHDAAISVGAGFAGNELTALWSEHLNWQIIERPAGTCSHLFVARKKKHV